MILRDEDDARNVPVDPMEHADAVAAEMRAREVDDVHAFAALAALREYARRFVDRDQRFVLPEDPACEIEPWCGCPGHRSGVDYALSMKPDREIVFGLRAGLAVFAKRRDDILRIGYAREVKGEVAELVAWAGRRVPCDELTARDLERVADSSHHEGLVVATKPRVWTTPKDLAERLRGTAIALDRVRNPYNIGAILRSAAFFGVDAAILGELAPAAIRVAEGGAEHLSLVRTTDLADTLGRLRAKGARVVGADVRGEKPSIDLAKTRPLVMVLGHEREGVGERIRAQCDAMVRIDGSGAVESLNVAVAAGILISSMFV
jgi:TrmH RNA methyltransferase